jgi:hypothetical protein
MLSAEVAHGTLYALGVRRQALSTLLQELLYPPAAVSSRVVVAAAAMGNTANNSTSATTGSINVCGSLEL